MFLAWGRQGKVAHLGDAGIRACERCEKESHFQHLVSYTVRHFWWLFRWVTGKQEHLVCGHCGSAYAADEADPGDVAAAIPFLDRRGWTIGLGLIASIVAFAAVASAADDRENRGFLAAPHVGDIYELNAARLLANPPSPMMYSTMRVVAVDGSTVGLVLSRDYFTSRRGIDRDLQSGAARKDGYYGSEVSRTPRAQVAAWYDKGIILDVER